MSYRQLNYEKRCHINGLWQAGCNQTQIAKEMGVHNSTITRELKRNITFVRTALGSWQYKPDYAQSYTKERHKKKNKRIKFTAKVEEFVREKLLLDWSPEQISGYAKKHHLFEISHEWIYQFILKDKQKQGNLYKHLRHQNKRYRKRYGSPKRAGPIRNRRFIEERPNIVEEKKRIGDWEIDTIISKNHKQAIVTIVERVSRKTRLSKVKTKTAKLASNAAITSLKSCSKQVLTITGDNGSEFAHHEKISKHLRKDFYFAHPYSSWERGLNENTNGLVRQYLKKGTYFKLINLNKLAFIMNRLNNRPRKTLGYATPTLFQELCQIKSKLVHVSRVNRGNFTLSFSRNRA